MIARDKDGKIIGSSDFSAFLDDLNKKLPNVSAEEKAKYNNVTIIGDLPELGSISADAKKKMEQMQKDFEATDIPIVNDVAQIKDNSKLILLGAGLVLLLIITR